MGLSKNNLIQDESSEKLFFTKLTALVYPFFMFKVIRKKDQDMFETHVDLFFNMPLITLIIRGYGR